MYDLISYPSTKIFFCLFLDYPVHFEPNFDHLFPRFKGFSDHTLGYAQTIRAIEAGAQIIEKHFTLDHKDIECPDFLFCFNAYSTP